MKPELYISAWFWVHSTPKSTSLYAAHHVHYDDSFQQTWISVLLYASKLGIIAIISMCDLGIHEKYTTKKVCVCTWQKYCILLLCLSKTIFKHICIFVYVKN